MRGGRGWGCQLKFRVTIFNTIAPFQTRKINLMDFCYMYVLYNFKLEISFWLSFEVPDPLAPRSTCRLRQFSAEKIQTKNHATSI